MKYRIIIETERSGKKHYYIQKFIFFWWSYLVQITDMSMAEYRVDFESLVKAENHIQSIINKEKEEFEKKIIKREVYENVIH